MLEQYEGTVRLLLEYAEKNEYEREKVHKLKVSWLPRSDDPIASSRAEGYSTRKFKISSGEVMCLS